MNEQVRAVAFQLLLKTRGPVSIATLANELGPARNQVEAEVAQLDRQGLIRRSPGGDVVGSAGLSVVPSRHELHIGDQRFWTWCAYDAVGILAALGASGRVLSASPLDGAPIEVRVRGGLPEQSDVVLFMPDFFAARTEATPWPEAGVSVFDDWCPQINFFQDTAASLAWAEQRGVRGQVLSLPDAARRGATRWQPVVSSPPALSGRPLSPTVRDREDEGSNPSPPTKIRIQNRLVR